MRSPGGSLTLFQAGWALDSSSWHIWCQSRSSALAFSVGLKAHQALRAALNIRFESASCSKLQVAAVLDRQGRLLCSVLAVWNRGLQKPSILQAKQQYGRSQAWEAVRDWSAGQAPWQSSGAASWRQPGDF